MAGLHSFRPSLLEGTPLPDDRLGKPWKKTGKDEYEWEDGRKGRWRTGPSGKRIFCPIDNHASEPVCSEERSFAEAANSYDAGVSENFNPDEWQVF